MNDKVLFSERQKFTQWWLWAILVGINGMFVSGAYMQVIKGEQFGNKPMSNEGLLVAAGVSILLTILFFIFRLETLVKDNGIYVRFFPLHISFKYYPWDNISKSFVRQYRPMSEYGGWGFRYGFFGNGRAFNVSGDTGLQLEFLDHSKLLIGTNKPDELTETLNIIGQLKR